jgi:hypothetical protein
MPNHYDKKTSSKKTSSKKLSDKQKADLKKHMDKLDGLTPSQKKSHRMKMMSNMRKGMSISKSHKMITS